MLKALREQRDREYLELIIRSVARHQLTRAQTDLLRRGRLGIYFNLDSQSTWEEWRAARDLKKVKQIKRNK